MSSSKSKIGCCGKSTSLINTLSCPSCEYKYHLTCINIQKPLKELTEEFKLKFICPSCSSKLPKLDNTNTPVKTPLITQESLNYMEESSCSNINSKRGSQPSQKNLTADSIRQIIKEELEIVLQSFRASILLEIEVKTKEVLDRFDEISNSVQKLEKRQETFKKDIEANTANIDSLRTENTKLKKAVADLNSRVSLMEQHSRANNLEIQNVPEHKSESLNSLVKQIASVIDYKLEETDLHYCSRIAKLNKNNPRPRSIVVKFCSQKIRDSFLASSIRFNKRAKNRTDKLNTADLGIGGEKKPVFVLEHLSPFQKALHAEARNKAKELNYKFVWVKGGKIYMRKTETSEYRLVKNSEQLSGLL